MAITIWRFGIIVHETTKRLDLYIHSIKKVPGINHSRSPPKKIVKNGISCAESLKILQRAYDESILSKTRAYEWYSAFKSGRDVVEDLPRSGRPSTSSTEINIAKVKEIVTENHHLSLREIVAELSVSHESIRTILNDSVGMKHVAARLVRKDLNFL